MDEFSIIGISRGNEYSPNHVDNDAAIFNKVADELRLLGCKVELYAEKEFVACGAKADVIFDMARDRVTIARLKSLEDEGALVVNSAYGIDNCVRRPMTELLIQHGVPHPRSFVISTDRQFEEDCYPCWIKRGDSHAMVKEDVCYATGKEEVERVLADFRSRHIPVAVINEHLQGDLIKFYGVFRAAHPLYTIVTPEQNQAFIRSLLRKYDEGGILPKWELASNETGTMIGYHAVSVIADAMMKKQCDFDVKKALEACIRSSVYDTTGVTPMMDRQILNGKLMPVSIKYKNELGYIPCDKVGGSVSQGLEFAYNDWLIAQMMKEHNRKDFYDKYMELSRNYRNYFDPETKLMRGRLSDGSWITSFDPASVQRPSNYVEGNAWQWAWFVPQDVEGLMELVGGQKYFEAHLDTLFTTSSELTGDPNAAADVTGMIGQYAHGNEPSHHIPYLYNYAGAPRKTQALVDHILRTLYHNDPNGLSGNEDVGQMSAWYALSAMGFYSFCPGRPVYEIGRPIFDKVTIHLSNGKDFVIQAKNNSVENKYIRSMKLNGEDLAEPRFSHFDLMKGGELIFEMEN